MAQDLHHNALIDAQGEQQGGSGVPGIMDPDLADSGRFEQSSPFVPVGVVTDRPPVGLAPDEIVIVPGWPGGHALVKLSGPVCLERRDELGRKRDGPPALNRGAQQPLTCPLGAGPGRPRPMLLA